MIRYRMSVTLRPGKPREQLNYTNDTLFYEKECRKVLSNGFRDCVGRSLKARCSAIVITVCCRGHDKFIGMLLEGQYTHSRRPGDYSDLFTARTSA
jgi:hypothetical protein